MQALYEELLAGAQQVFYKQTMQGRVQHALIQIKVGKEPHSWWQEGLQRPVDHCPACSSTPAVHPAYPALSPNAPRLSLAWVQLLRQARNPHAPCDANIACVDDAVFEA